MTTAREKAEAFAASCLYGADNSDAITHAARQLLAIIDKRFAELREKENAAPRPATAEAWVPTEQQIMSVLAPAASNKLRHSEFYTEASQMRWDSVRAGMLAGHRIAKENQCSQSGSEQSSLRSSQSAQPSTTSVGNAASDTTTATAGTMPTSPTVAIAETTSRSLDARAEALFAANPEWRPRYGYQTLHLISGMDAWRWVDVPIGMSRGFVLQPDRNAHLLAALLPRAIDKWTANGREVSTGIFVRCNGNPPRDLESAINILEGT